MKKLPASVDRIFFLFSPLISLPLVLRGIFYQNKISLFLFCLCIGFMSFGFVSPEGFDKGYYLYLFQVYQNMPIEEFVYSFLQQKTDIIFYTILYFISWIGLPFEFFSLLVTFTTSYLILSVFYKQSILHNRRKTQAFLFFLIVVLAINLPSLLSGMRNYLSASLAFYGCNLLVNEKKEKKAAIFIFLSLITHFSSLIYILAALLYYFFNTRAVLLRFLFSISIFFTFLPKHYLSDALSLLQISELYSDKVDVYLGENSPSENSLIIGNFNNYFRILVNTLWFYITSMFIILNIKNSDKRFIFLICLMIFINLISSSLDLINRYALLANFAFLLALFYSKNIKYRKTFIYLMLAVNFLSFSTSFMVVRTPLVNSLSKIEFLTLPTIFFIDTTSEIGIKQ